MNEMLMMAFHYPSAIFLRRMAELFKKEGFVFPEKVAVRDLVSAEFFGQWLVSKAKETRWESIPSISTPVTTIWDSERASVYKATTFCYTEIVVTLFIDSPPKRTSIDFIQVEALTPKGNEVIDELHRIAVEDGTMLIDSFKKEKL